MTVNIERRRLVVGGALGLGALMLPVGRSLRCRSVGSERLHSQRCQWRAGFRFHVAVDSLRAADEASTKFGWMRKLALDPDFTRVVSGGSVRIGAYRDWTAKLTVDGLQPRTTYWYRFIAPDGGRSPVGRTKTLPVGDVDRFGLGVFSCSNLPLGWFNAYGHAAARDDLDLWLHVGDYIYEYGIDFVQGKRSRRRSRCHACARSRDDQPRRLSTATVLAIVPIRICRSCIRWPRWSRYGTTMTPPTTAGRAVRRITSRIPKAIGTSAARLRMQAYREWMPVSEEPWKAYRIGSLATLYRTESRLSCAHATRLCGAGEGTRSERSRSSAASISRWRLARSDGDDARLDAGILAGAGNEAQRRGFPLATGRHGHHHRPHLDAGSSARLASPRNERERNKQVQEGRAWLQARRADVDGSLGRLSCSLVRVC